MINRTGELEAEVQRLDKELNLPEVLGQLTVYEELWNEWDSATRALRVEKTLWDNSLAPVDSEHSEFTSERAYYKRCEMSIKLMNRADFRNLRKGLNEHKTFRRASKEIDSGLDHYNLNIRLRHEEERRSNMAAGFDNSKINLLKYIKDHATG